MKAVMAKSYGLCLTTQRESVSEPSHWERKEVVLASRVEEWYEVTDLSRSDSAQIRHNRVRNSLDSLAVGSTVVVTNVCQCYHATRWTEISRSTLHSQKTGKDDEEKRSSASYFRQF